MRAAVTTALLLLTMSLACADRSSGGVGEYDEEEVPDRDNGG